MDLILKLEIRSYNKTGDKVNAIKCYIQALGIKEIPETRKKLKELQEKK